MSLDAAMRDACAAVGILPPRRDPVPGRWTPCPVGGKAASNTSGRVLVAVDGRSGVAWNHVTGQHVRFTADGPAGAAPPAMRRDPEHDRRIEAERRETAAICARILKAAVQEPHPYLERKGFPAEVGLVTNAPLACVPDTPHGRAVAASIPKASPLLIVPGRIGRELTTLQLIDAAGAKKNLYGGRMLGSSHRIATGHETWVCEGIATALSVRAALRLLGRSATVLCAFSASNVESVARAHPGALIAADNDKPLPQFGGMGTGEFFARRSGCAWVMPPERGDWNDHHQAHGLREVAMLLREVRPA
ncbi:MAG: toprim domain-containing protein [Rhodospirillales bacterium]|nr:toprim domain-containing protein [Rhodospirillales bacterium]